MEVFYTVSLTLNAVCALAIMLSGIQKQKKEYLTLALLNIVIFFFHIFSWQLHISTSLNSAIQMSRYQTMFAIIALPLISYTFSCWCKFKYTKQLTTIYALIAIPLLILNFTGVSSLRYGTDIQFIQFYTHWGTKISLLNGPLHPVYSGVHLMFLIHSLTLAIFSYRLFQQRESIISLSLVFLLIFQVFVGFVGYKIDKLEWNFFYIGGLPLTIFSIICLFLISSLYKDTSEKLKKEEEQRAEIENAMKSLARETSDSGNFNFYTKTSQNIQNLFKTKLVFIGLYCTDELGGRIETLAVMDNGKIVPNFSYSLTDSPSNEVVGKKMCVFENNVDKRFPHDVYLTEMGIKSYVGLPIFNSEKQPVGIVALLHNIKYIINPELISLLDVYAERIGAELSRDNLAKKLKELAYFDYITKLPNRASLFEKISSTYRRNYDNKVNSLLILLDLDHFKELNKIYGYDVADDILKEIGHRLNVYANKNIFVARNDGDEFAILIDQLNDKTDSLIDIHWKAISAIIKFPIYLNDQKIIVECSAGNVIFPLQTSDRYSVIRYAESALQQAKYNGRNQYAVFDKNIQAVFDRKQIILKEIHEAMQVDNQLFMVYQPQTDSKGKMLSAEALIRWTSPVHGFISPGEFIPIVEQTELIHALGDWIVRNVLSQLQAWKLAGFQTPEHISINVASKQLIHHDFVPKLVGFCHEFSILPSQIVLELTESGILTDTSFAIESLKSLKNHGFRIALDDFGTGYSSLSYLKDLPIDILKIDKSFIDDIFSSSTKQLIQSMFSIAQHLKLDIIAEGTESKEQIDALTKLGCNCFQGYYYSKPLKAEQLMDWNVSCLNSEIQNEY